MTQSFKPITDALGGVQGDFGCWENPHSVGHSLVVLSGLFFFFNQFGLDALTFRPIETKCGCVAPRSEPWAPLERNLTLVI